MKAPLIMHVSIIAEAVPFVLGMLLPSRQTEARRWLMLWSALDTITNLAGSYLGRHHLHNLFLGYFYTPVEGAILMWMLAFWHPDPGTRRRLRWGIPAMVAGWVLLVMLFEDPQTFSRIVDLAYNVLMTSLFLHLLVRRSADDAAPATGLVLDQLRVCDPLRDLRRLPRGRARSSQQQHGNPDAGVRGACRAERARLLVHRGGDDLSPERGFRAWGVVTCQR
jgi:hypothetical protein